MFGLTISHLIGVLVLVSCVSANFPLPSPKAIEPRVDGVFYRLPNSTRPEAYQVDLVTNVHNADFAFTGTVAIDIVAYESTSIIVLHQRQLTIGTITLQNNPPTGTPIPLGVFEYDGETEFLTVPLAAGSLTVNARYTLTISFTGTLRGDEAGFYRSSYVADNGERRWLATTQFESTDARHGFPCYDEPAFRANFTISIRHGATYNAISNMPGSRATNADGTVTTSFQTTPKTPTYLIAYVVSDFLERNNRNNAQAFPHATYARPNAINGADFSVEVAEKILKGFDDYLNIPFSHSEIPKMDQIAIPDFAAGAMENWGLVTYREPYLLLFENSTFTTKTNIVTIVAHEFAHQWFGNLVTPSWWTYLWLNEGFATLFEHYATDWVFPEWKILDVFVYQTLQSVFQNDARETTRPMTHYVEHPTEISNLFDSVAYSKSGCVLRMMLHALGESTFQKGLENYLRDKQFTYADEYDLFAGLQLAARADGAISASQSVSEIMVSWTQQKGFPMVRVERNYATGTITLRQEKYLTEIPTTENFALWWIPYNFATANSPDFTNTATEGWIPETRTATVEQSAGKTWSADDWVVFNKQQTGFYRVLYDEQNYNLIVNQLTVDASKIHLTSRAQLIDDAFDFARSGRLNYATAFDVVQHLEHDIEYVPWGSALRGLSVVNRMLAATSEYPQFQNFTRILIQHLYQHVGITDKGDDEPHFQKQARILAINWACNMGLEECLTQTAAVIPQSISSLHVNVRGAVLCNGLRNSNENQYKTVFNLLHTATDPNERNRIISGLGCSSNKTILLDYLYTSDASSEAEIPFTSQAERYRVFTSVVENGQVGLGAAIEFLQNDLVDAARAFGTTNINNAFTTMASYVVDTPMETEFLRVLQNALQLEIITAATNTRATEIIAENKAWLSSHQSHVESWIAQFHLSREGDESSASALSLSAFVVVVVLTIARFV